MRGAPVFGLRRKFTGVLCCVTLFATGCSAHSTSASSTKPSTTADKTPNAGDLWAAAKNHLQHDKVVNIRFSGTTTTFGKGTKAHPAPAVLQETGGIGTSNLVTAFRSGTASIETLGTSNSFYVKGSEEFWSEKDDEGNSPDPATIKPLINHWVKEPAFYSMSTSMMDLTTYLTGVEDSFGEVSASLTDPSARVEASSANGTPAWKVTGTNGYTAWYSKRTSELMRYTSPSQGSGDIQVSTYEFLPLPKVNPFSPPRISLTSTFPRRSGTGAGHLPTSPALFLRHRQQHPGRRNTPP